MFDAKSMDEYGKERFLTLPLWKWMLNNYSKKEEDRESALISPIATKISDLKGFPPTLIVVAEEDILRDDAERLGRKLNKAGVEVTTVRYNGVIHDFGLLNALSNIPETKAMIRQVASELTFYLQ